MIVTADEALAAAPTPAGEVEQLLRHYQAATARRRRQQALRSAEEQRLELTAAALGVPFLESAPDAEPGLAELLPAAMALEQRLAPLSRIGAVLVVATSRADLPGIRGLTEGATGLAVQLVLATPKVVRTLQAAHYGASSPGTEEPPTP